MTFNDENDIAGNMADFLDQQKPSAPIESLPISDVARDFVNVIEELDSVDQGLADAVEGTLSRFVGIVEEG